MRTLFLGILSVCLVAAAFGQEVIIDKNKSCFAKAFQDAGFEEITLDQSMSNGTLNRVNFDSEYLQESRTMFVYLPSCDDTVGCEQKTYPVVYFLHPAGFGKYGSFSLRFLADFGSDLLDDLIAQEKIKPMIAVFPDGSEPEFGMSFYTNSGLYGAFEDHIVEEVIDVVDNNFPTKKHRRRRGILGQSAGGYGAIKLAFNHTDIYRAVASHSGPLNLALLPTLIDNILAEYDEPPYNYDPNAGIFSELLFQMAGAFSPNLWNSSYPVDLPLDSEGNIIDSIFGKWLDHNPALLAKQLTPNTELAIYFDVGTEDELGLFPMTESFVDTLRELDIAFDYRPYEGGGHFAPSVILQRVEQSITYMDSVLNRCYGCNCPLGAFIPKQLAAIDLEPSDLAIEYGNKIYDKYRSEIENIFAILARHPEIQFDLYHVLKDAKSFINDEAREKILNKKTHSDVVDLLNRLYAKAEDPTTSAFIKTVARAVESAEGGASYEELLATVANHLSNDSNQTLAELSNDNEDPVNKFRLEQNYPNPFNPTTSIKFSLAEKTFVSLTIYNTAGQKVATLVNQELPAGETSATWDATGLASGIYFMKFRAGEFVQVRRMILMQ